MSRETAPRGERIRSATKIVAPQQPLQRHLYSDPQAITLSLVLENKKTFVQPLPITPRTPRTPRTSRRNSSQDGYNSYEYGSKPRSHKKCNSKNIITSPNMNKKIHSISPPSGSQSAGFLSESANVPPVAAYAGPTFHASPAPSTLPIPSFYSKSTPDSPKFKDLKSVVSNQISTPPTTLRPPDQGLRQESPLDIFFKADREQKERARNLASTIMTSAASEVSPLKSSRFIHCVSSSNSKNLTQIKFDSKLSASAMFSMDLDEESDSNISYRASLFTKYYDRINAVNSENNNSTQIVQPPKIPLPIDRAEALKAYLFSGHPTSNPSDFQSIS